MAPSRAGRRASRYRRQRSDALLTLAFLVPSTAAVALSDFQPAAVGLTPSCQAVYTQQIPNCTPADFLYGAPCSNQCIGGVASLNDPVLKACGTNAVNNQELIQQFLLGNGIATLCPNVLVGTAASFVSTNPTVSTSPAVSSASTLASVASSSTAQSSSSSTTSSTPTTSAISSTSSTSTSSSSSSSLPTTSASSTTSSSTTATTTSSSSSSSSSTTSTPASSTSTSTTPSANPPPVLTSATSATAAAATTTCVLSAGSPGSILGGPQCRPVLGRVNAASTSAEFSLGVLSSLVGGSVLLVLAL